MAFVYVGVYEGLGDGGRQRFKFCIDDIGGRGLFTYSLIHADALHLAFNTYGMIVYGGIIEVLQRPLRVAVVYAIAVLMGPMGEVWKYKCGYVSDFTCLAGASAGVYGLIGSYVGQTVWNWHDCNTVKGSVVRIVYPIMCVCAIVSDIVFTLAMKVKDVSYAGHVAGFLSGLLTSFLFYRKINGDVPHVAGRWWIVGVSFGIWVVLITLSVVFATELNAARCPPTGCV